jgi:hypothetical protein
LIDFEGHGATLGPDGRQLSAAVAARIKSGQDGEDPLVQPNRRHAAPP